MTALTGPFQTGILDVWLVCAKGHVLSIKSVELLPFFFWMTCLWWAQDDKKCDWEND